MPTRQEMLDKTTEIIANKEVSPWCRVYDINDPEEVFEVADRWDRMIKRVEIKCREYNVVQNPFGRYVPINVVWHPVTIGDVYQWLFDNKMEANVVYARNPIRWWKAEPYSSNKDFIFYRRENRRKPIDDQSDECIQFVYSLLPTK